MALDGTWVRVLPVGGQERVFEAAEVGRPVLLRLQFVSLFQSQRGFSL